MVSQVAGSSVPAIANVSSVVIDDCLSSLGISRSPLDLPLEIYDLASVEDCKATSEAARPVHWVSAKKPESLAGELIVDEFQGTWYAAEDEMIWHNQASEKVGFRCSSAVRDNPLPYVKAVATAMSLGAKSESVQMWLSKSGQVSRRFS